MADDNDRHDLPDSIYTMADAARVARGLTAYFQDTDDTLARLANAIASVAEARQQDIDDTSRYGARVTFVDGDGDAHTALVMEPEVASMHADEAWDPNRGEMVDPQEAYPHGTIQLVYTPEFDLSDGFNFDRLSHLEVATSVTPATEPEDVYCYYPKWGMALEDSE